MKKPSINEAVYFSERAAEQRREVRRKIEEASARLEAQKAIASTLDTEDQELVQRIHALGFSGDSARVFDLLPLVHVAWADGKIQRKERATIFAALEARGIKPQSEACVLMETLLETAPAEAFMEASLHLLRDLLARQTEQATNVVDLCVQVADAAGGLLRLGNRISEERQLIREMADTLGPEAKEQSRIKLIERLSK